MRFESPLLTSKGGVDPRGISDFMSVIGQGNGSGIRHNTRIPMRDRRGTKEWPMFSMSGPADSANDSGRSGGQEVRRLDRFDIAPPGHWTLTRSGSSGDARRNTTNPPDWRTVIVPGGLLLLRHLRAIFLKRIRSIIDTLEPSWNDFLQL